MLSKPVKGSTGIFLVIGQLIFIATEAIGNRKKSNLDYSYILVSVYSMDLYVLNVD